MDSRQGDRTTHSSGWQDASSQGSYSNHHWDTNSQSGEDKLSKSEQHSESTDDRHQLIDSTAGNTELWKKTTSSDTQSYLVHDRQDQSPAAGGHGATHVEIMDVSGTDHDEDSQEVTHHNDGTVTTVAHSLQRTNDQSQDTETTTNDVTHESYTVGNQGTFSTLQSTDSTQLQNGGTTTVVQTSTVNDRDAVTLHRADSRSSRTAPNDANPQYFVQSIR